METSKYKSFLLKIYFSNLDYSNFDNLELKLTYKDTKILSLLHLPKKLVRKYYLVAIDNNHVNKCRINYKDKDAIKYFLKLINNEKKDKTLELKIA